MLWEDTKMQSDACASQLLAHTVNAGSTGSAVGSSQGQKQRQARLGIATKAWPAAGGSAEHGTSIVITDAMTPLHPSNFAVISCCS